MSKSKAYSDEEQSIIDTPPTSPDSNDSSKSEEGLSNKEAAKIASRAFGYIQRSIELLGKDSNKLAGAVSPFRVVLCNFIKERFQ